MKKNGSFTLISFVVLKWVQLPFELPFPISDQSLLELEANVLDQNVYVLEFELYLECRM